MYDYITVDDDGMYDGEMKRFQLAGSGSEEPLFRMKPGAVLRNVIISDLVGDGIRCMGNCSLENVWFEDVGTGNAVSVPGSAPVGSVIHIVGGGLQNALGNAIMVGGPVKMNIEGFQFDEFQVAVFICQRCKTRHELTEVVIRDSLMRYSATTRALVLSDSPASDNRASVTRLSALRSGDADFPQLCQLSDCNVSGTRNITSAPSLGVK